MKTSFGAVWRLIISMTIFGTIGIFVKGIDLSSGEIAFFRAVLAAALLLAVLLLRGDGRRLFSVDRRTLFLLLLSGVFIGFNWILLFEAYRYVSVSVATLSYYFAPVLVTVCSPILFHERLTLRGGVAFGMSTLGLVLMTYVEGEGASSGRGVGILLGLSAAVLYASVILLNKTIGKIDGIHRTFLQFLSAIAVLLPYVLLTGGFHLSALNGQGYISLLIVGLLHTGVTYCLYFSSVKELSGQAVALFSYVDPLVAVLASVLILKESIAPLQILGGVMILGFTLWNELTGKGK